MTESVDALGEVFINTFFGPIPGGSVSDAQLPALSKTCRPYHHVPSGGESGAELDQLSRPGGARIVLLRIHAQPALSVSEQPIVLNGARQISTCCKRDPPESVTVHEIVVEPPEGIGEVAESAVT